MGITLSLKISISELSVELGYKSYPLCTKVNHLWKHKKFYVCIFKFNS